MSKRFPSEFEALLSPSGRRLLVGAGPAAGALSRQPFFSAVGLLDARQLPACTAILARTFADVITEQAQRLPAANSAIFAHLDQLPKVGRQLTTPLFDHSSPEETRALPAFVRAEECGLAQMLRSPSYHAFCQALAGRPLEGPAANQVLCYRPGDYVGPHTDHHPDEPRLKHGYVDVHLTFCTAGVLAQDLYYERDGHLAEQRSVAASGTVTAYRLPVWHHVTPLRTKRKTDRRWLVLGSFLFADSQS